MANPGERSVKLEGYVDSDFTGDLDKRKFISGYLFKFDNYLIS